MKYILSASNEDKAESTEINQKSVTMPLAETYIADQFNMPNTSIPITKFSVDNPPRKIEERVFIGGDYKLMPVLRQIATFVSENGFYPIIAQDFDIPYELTRDYTLRLLAQCRYAIFELTSQSGQMSEIGILQVFDFIKKLFVYSKNSEPSVMYMQMNPRPQPYGTFDELRQIISDFLHT